MKVIEAKVKLIGITPLSQSRKHSVDPEEGESPDAFDKRTWRAKMHTLKTPDGEFLTLPAHGLQQALAAGAKYTGKKVPGKGGRQWGGIFEKGVTVPFDPVSNVLAADVGFIDIFANADGKRGSGKRVPRRFPQVERWEAEALFWVMEPSITETIFLEMLSAAGMFIGIGRFRPVNGGINGRFRPELVSWGLMSGGEMAA